MKTFLVSGALALLSLSCIQAAPLINKRQFAEFASCYDALGFVICSKAGYDAILAKSATEALIEDKTFPVGSGVNGIADAFRHCYWSALMAIDVGDSNAKVVGELHEEIGNNTMKASEMDLFNNSKGREIGIAALQYEKDSARADSRSKAQCIVATSNGTLQVTDKK